MTYTISQLAKIAGISPRTLRHYDAIGLFTPAHVQENGYRMYTSKQLVRLQQILFFRELDFSLKDIQRIMSATYYDAATVLADQKKLLELKRDRIEGLIQTINTTMSTHIPSNIRDEELYDAFDDAEVKKYEKEVKERWGKTEAYAQSIKRLSKMTKEDIARFKEKTHVLHTRLAKAMDRPIEGTYVQALIDEHHASIEVWYDCDAKAYRALGEMYVSDPRFKATYDNIAPGLAQFLCNAIAVWCDAHEHAEG